MIQAVQLHDPNIYPDEDVLRSVLRNAYRVYQSLLEMYTSNRLAYEWRFYTDAKTWLCKVQLKKRTIVWMSACDGYIQATIYFPDMHINEVYGLEISSELVASIKNAGKSKPCIFKLKSQNDLLDFNRVMQFKMISK